MHIFCSCDVGANTFILNIKCNSILFYPLQVWPGRKFLMMFPPHNDPTARVNHLVTITAAGVGTSVTEGSGKQLHATHLPLCLPCKDDWPAKVCGNAQWSLLLSPQCELYMAFYSPSSHSGPPLVVTTASFMICPPGWPTTIPLIFTSLTRLLSVRWWSQAQTMRHQWISSSQGKCSLKAIRTPGVVSLRCWGAAECLSPEQLQPLWLRVELPWSCTCWGWFYLLQTHIWGLLVWICWTETSPSLEFWLHYPALDKHRNEFQFPVGNSYYQLWPGYHHQNLAKDCESWLVGRVMKVIPVVTSDKIHITSQSPIGLVYIRRYNEQHPSTQFSLPV